MMNGQPQQDQQRLKSLKHDFGVRGMKLSSMIKKMLYAGLDLKVEEFLKLHRDLFTDMESVWESCRQQNLGSLAVLPYKILQLIVCRLQARDVRGVSKALRASFDSINTRLVLDHSDDSEAVPSDLQELFVDLVCCSPQVSEVRLKSCSEKMKDLRLLNSTLNLVTGLKKLDLSNCVLDTSIERDLVPFLQGLPGLQVLDLRIPLESPYDISSVSPGLEGLPDLQELHIHMHPVRDLTSLPSIQQEGMLKELMSYWFNVLPSVSNSHLLTHQSSLLGLLHFRTLRVCLHGIPYPTLPYPTLPYPLNPIGMSPYIMNLLRVTKQPQQNDSFLKIQQSEIRSREVKMSMMIKKMLYAGLDVEEFQRRHCSILKEMESELESCGQQNLGSLAILPQKALQLIVSQLKARHVRGVSRALRSSFDACNTRLVFGQQYGVEAVPSDLQELLTDLMCYSPQVSKVCLKYMMQGGIKGLDLMGSTLNLLTGLQTLDLTPCVLGWNGAKALVPYLQSLSGLQVLDFRVCLTNSDALLVLSPGLRWLTDLQALHIRFRERHTEGIPKCIKALVSVLPRLTNLQDLDFPCLNMNAEDVTALAPVLQTLTNLRSLNLAASSMGPEGAAAFGPALCCLPKLTDLNLSENDIGAKGAACLAQSLNGLPSLVRLDLYKNQLKDKGAAALAPGLTGLTNLRAIRLKHNFIGAKGAAALGSALQCLPELTGLDLSINQMGDEGVAALDPALQCLTKLQALNLSGNGLGKRGATCLAHSLTSLTGLRQLIVYGNKFGDKGAAALAPGLVGLTNLLELDLERNKIREEGIAALTPVLQSLSELTKLEIGYNGFGPDTESALTSALEGLPNLSHLHLGWSLELDMEDQLLMF